MSKNIPKDTRIRISIETYAALKKLKRKLTFEHDKDYSFSQAIDYLLKNQK